MRSFYTDKAEVDNREGEVLREVEGGAAKGYGEGVWSTPEHVPNTGAALPSVVRGGHG